MMKMTLCQCLGNFWTEQREDVALVQLSPSEKGARRAHVRYAQVREWQQEVRMAVGGGGGDGGWMAVGVNLASFSIEETATMLLVAEERHWIYVPIDAELSLVRQLSLLRSAGVRRLVTTAESPLAKVFIEKEGGVEWRAADLNASPFRPVRVVEFASNCFRVDESELERTRQRLAADRSEQELVAPLYVLFTSGTTGKPRGVLGTRAGAWSRLEWMWKAYPFARSTSGGRTSERVLRATKLAFVDSVWEILGAFLQRVPLVHLQAPRREDESTSESASFPMKSVVLDDSLRFLEVIRSENVTRFTAVPSMLEVLLLQTTEKDRHSSLAGLRYVISSGESLSLHVLQQLATGLPDVTILNLYGSTELSGDVTCMELKAPLSSTQTSEWQQHGVPLANLDRHSVVGDDTSLLLLSDDIDKNCAATIIWPTRSGSKSISSTDTSREPTRGVLYVSGPLLTYGYIGDGHEGLFKGSDELPGGPYNSLQQSVSQARRWLCTGDICSVIQGHLYFCGRKDNAVKLYGQRVYLEAVERAVAAALKETTTDSQFCSRHRVVAFTTTKQVSKYALLQQRIVACLICDDIRSSSVARYSQTRTLNAWIADHYGASHTPHELLLVSTNAVPRLAHGKIDRHALQNLLAHDTGDTNVSLQNPTTKGEMKGGTEKLVARLLMEIVDVPLSGRIPDSVRSQTFKDVGGNSLLATLFAHELRQEVAALPLTNVELLEMTIGEVVSALDSRSEKRPREEPTQKMSTESTNRTSKVLTEADSCTTELKRRKNIHPALSDESTDDARDGRRKQGLLTFLSRSNQSSLGVNGVHLPTCYASPVASSSEPSLCLSLELRTMWRVDLGKCIDASPLLVQRRNREGAVSSTWAIVGSHSAQFVCVDVLAAGREVWRVTLDDRIEASAALSVKHELVYVGTYAGTLFALDLQSGEKRWRFQAKGTIKASALVMDEQGLVLCGAYDNNLYGLDSVTSQQRWKINLQGSIFSTPLYCAGSGHLFVASTNGNVVSLTSTSSGIGHFNSVKEQWRLQLPAPVFAGLNVDYESKMLLVGCADGQLYGVNMTSGVAQWQLATEKPIFSSPCVYRSGSVVFGSHDGMLRKADSRTGELVWAINLNGAVFASPTVVRLLAQPPNRYAVGSDLACCVTTTTGQLCFCDEKTGSIIYQSGDSSGKALDTANSGASSSDLGPLFGSPVLVDNWCLLGTRTNDFYGFELTSTSIG
ncbi:hypothetical protein PHYPSEUDO_003243 [Phytophthora pseudosyringae]|uniref:Carrier domain-containing protein n=1 Tax=Phytophthora pseudosyringae TaxID=221518 RepID=A0A8T1VSF5_9STRA|nr:hypothetical protein PHYPSEUDO_003243 [Phytophthora pseudosyringae]